MWLNNKELLDELSRQIVAQSAPVIATTLSSVVIVVGLLLSGLTFLITWAIGRPVLSWLRKKKFGKSILVDGPQSHLVKTGTPTMGGIMMSISIVLVMISFVLVPFVQITGGRGLSVLLPIGIVISCSILGALDDLLSLVTQKPLSLPVATPTPAPVPVAVGVGASSSSTSAMPIGVATTDAKPKVPSVQHGMKARFKMAWLLAISTVAACMLYFPLDLHKVYVPFIREPIELDWWLYIPIAIFVITGTANAVNFTDGMDSLAASTAAVAFGAYGIIGFVQLQPQVVLMAFTVSGACFGFLWYNAFPAQVFMGDTGSLMLGALLAVLAFQTNQWLLLPLIGGVFVAEALSVIIQVSYFKYTKRRYGVGKRAFKMSPLHNHFEVGGLSETQVSMRFWLFSMVLALLGVALALL